MLSFTLFWNQVLAQAAVDHGIDIQSIGKGAVIGFCDYHRLICAVAVFRQGSNFPAGPRRFPAPLWDFLAHIGRLVGASHEAFPAL